MKDLEPKDIKHVLFVCTGNSCRSIMAEAYLKKRFAEEGMQGEVQSAGTLGIDGVTPTYETIEILREEGINADGYESQALKEELINWADIVLVMEPSHRARVLVLAPQAEDKVYYLAGLSVEGNGNSIPDPIGRPLSYYNTVFDLIKQSIEELIVWLKQ